MYERQRALSIWNVIYRTIPILCRSHEYASEKPKESANKKSRPPNSGRHISARILLKILAASSSYMSISNKYHSISFAKKTQIRKQKVPPAKRQTVQRTYTRFFFTILQRILGIASRLLISRKLLPNSSWILGFESPIPAPITITPSCCNFLMTSRTVSP